MPPSPATEKPPAVERYEDFSAKQKTAAKSGWLSFMASKTPEQLAELKRLGITGFADDHDHIGPPEDGPPAEVESWSSEYENLKVDVDFAARCDTLADELLELYDPPRSHDDHHQQMREIAQMIEDRVAAEVERRKAEQLQTIAAFMIAPGNARKRALGLAYVANLDALNGIGSQEEAGKKTLSSRASINTEANKWRDLFGMPQNGHMKADAARGTYSQDKSSENHWRRKKFKRKNPKPKKKPSRHALQT